MVCFSSIFSSFHLFRQCCKEQPLHLDSFFMLRFAFLAFPTTVHPFATCLLSQSEEFMNEDGQFPINPKASILKEEIYLHVASVLSISICSYFFHYWVKRKSVPIIPATPTELRHSLLITSRKWEIEISSPIHKRYNV